MEKISLNDITIRTDIHPGDLGYVIYLHGSLYSREYDFDLAFEQYVAEGMTEFFKAYEPARSRVWVCCHQDTIIGFLALVNRGSTALLFARAGVSRHWSGTKADGDVYGIPDRLGLFHLLPPYHRRASGRGSSLPKVRISRD
jgi:hypothetical protein